MMSVHAQEQHTPSKLRSLAMCVGACAHRLPSRRAAVHWRASGEASSSSMLIMEIVPGVLTAAAAAASAALGSAAGAIGGGATLSRTSTACGSPGEVRKVTPVFLPYPSRTYGHWARGLEAAASGGGALAHQRRLRWPTSLTVQKYTLSLHTCRTHAGNEGPSLAVGWL